MQNHLAKKSLTLELNNKYPPIARLMPNIMTLKRLKSWNNPNNKNNTDNPENTIAVILAQFFPLFNPRAIRNINTVTATKTRNTKTAPPTAKKSNAPPKELRARLWPPTPKIEIRPIKENNAKIAKEM